MWDFSLNRLLLCVLFPLPLSPPPTVIKTVNEYMTRHSATAENGSCYYRQGVSGSAYHCRLLPGTTWTKNTCDWLSQPFFLGGCSLLPRTAVSVGVGVRLMTTASSMGWHGVEQLRIKCHMLGWPNWTKNFWIKLSQFGWTKTLAGTTVPLWQLVLDFEVQMFVFFWLDKQFVYFQIWTLSLGWNVQ